MVKCDEVQKMIETIPSWKTKIPTVTEFLKGVAPYAYKGHKFLLNAVKPFLLREVSDRVIEVKKGYIVRDDGDGPIVKKAAGDRPTSCYCLLLLLNRKSIWKFIFYYLICTNKPIKIKYYGNG